MWLLVILMLGPAMSKASTAKKIASKLARKADDAVKLSRDEALKILESIDSPEKAVALSGAEKQKYLDALDVVQGGRSKRASEVGVDLEHLKRVHAKADAKAAKNKTSGWGGDDIDFDGADDGQMEAYLSKHPNLRPKSFGAEVGGEFAGDMSAGRTPGADTIHVKDVNVEDDFKRRGAATEMYRAAEREFQLPLEPGVTGLSDESRALWANPDRPFGHKRLPDANFDTRFKDSPNILALTGGDDAAAKIAQKIGQRATTRAVQYGTEQLIPEVGPLSALKDLGAKFNENVYKGSALEKADNAREKAIGQTAKQLDLYRGATGRDDQQFQDVAGTAINFALPDTLDMVPGLGTAAAKVVKARKLGDAATIARQVQTRSMPNVAAEKAQHVFDNWRKADSMDLKKGSNLSGQPVYDSGPKDLGKTILKDETGKTIPNKLVYDKKIKY
jgi:hypothetical protein